MTISLRLCNVLGTVSSSIKLPYCGFRGWVQQVSPCATEFVHKFAWQIAGWATLVYLKELHTHT